MFTVDLLLLETSTEREAVHSTATTSTAVHSTATTSTERKAAHSTVTATTSTEREAVHSTMRTSTEKEAEHSTNIKEGNSSCSCSLEMYLLLVCAWLSILR